MTVSLPGACGGDLFAATAGAVQGLEGWISCFESAKLAGVARGCGADGMGQIKNFPAALESAYQMGKTV